MTTAGGAIRPQFLPALRAEAAALGFDVCRIARAELPAGTKERLADWIGEGKHGDMAWMADTFERRANPKTLWDGAASVIMLGINHAPTDNPMAATREPGRAAIATYAQRRDYHDVMKGRLKRLGGWIGKHARDEGVELKVFVDTAPVMEKPLAQAAGIGWQGKHTNLVSREFGSWLFLGSIFTNLALPPDEAERDHCGGCRACLDICPTRAFDGPYRLDARRCVSYLTIEHKGPIPRELRAGIGNRIFGCDDCLAVCPWNKFAKTAREAKLAAREELATLDLGALAMLDDAGFRALFAATPVKRIGFERFSRNVLVAIGNSGRPELAQCASSRLDDASALVRQMAVWALGRLLEPEAFAALARERSGREPDDGVRAEWKMSLRPDGQHPSS